MQAPEERTNSGLKQRAIWYAFCIRARARKRCFVPSFPTADWNAASIRAFRKRLGLSQRQFAILLGAGGSTVEAWEYGRAPSFAHRRKLCSALAEFEAGSLDLSWVQFEAVSRRAHHTSPRRVLRRIRKPDKRAKPQPLRARISITLIPPRRQAQLTRQLAALQILDPSALPGLCNHVRASIRQYLDALPALGEAARPQLPPSSNTDADSYDPFSGSPPSARFGT